MGKYMRCIPKFICPSFLLILLILDPLSAAEAVKNALSLCAGIILPSLLPFFFISALISSAGIPEAIAALLEKPMARFMSISSHAASPLIMGLLGGYPIGASLLADRVKEGKLRPDEAEKLLPMCNNTGPSFIIGAVGAMFSSFKAGILLYAVHIAAAIFVGLTLSRCKNPSRCSDFSSFTTDSGIIGSLPDCVIKSTEKCVSVCGFIIFFSVIQAIAEGLGIITALTLKLQSVSGLDIGICRSFILGVTELGGGIASMKNLALSPATLALASFILGFGSLSVHCQTLAAVSGTNIKCARHFVGRIMHGTVSAFLVYILSTFIRI